MRKFSLLLIIIFIIITDETPAQLKFRSGRFFHHSTGECIWGPNGSSTSVPQQMTIYNNSHGYTGTNAVTMTEMWFPVNYDNEWHQWHQIFETNTPENISSYFSTNRIIMIKSCFPSSALEGVGEPADTLSPDYKTIYNYKWHWRHIINKMKLYPQNFFIIWTNAPLVPLETNANAAMWSKRFCKWAKDTLAAGLDPVFGIFPANVYVFDFFSKLTDANGYMLLMYASDPHDSHPNATATTLVAPQLVNETFNHSIAYELIYGIKKINTEVPEKFVLEQNYPNPFNSVTSIRFKVTSTSPFPLQRGIVTLKVYDLPGREVATLINEYLQPGTYEVSFDGSRLNSGVYFYRLSTDGFSETKKLVLIK